MVKRHYGLRIPKAIVQDKLEPDPGNADNTIWRVWGGCIAAVEYADYISIGIAPDDEDEATFAQVLTNMKDLEDDSDEGVPDFFNEYEAFAAVLQHATWEWTRGLSDYWRMSYKAEIWAVLRASYITPLCVWRAINMQFIKSQEKWKH